MVSTKNPAYPAKDGCKPDRFRQAHECKPIIDTSMGTGQTEADGFNKLRPEVLEKEPHFLDYRMESNGVKKEKTA